MNKCKLEVLRKQMSAEGIDAYIVPTADPHQSEYISDHFKSRQFITGFTGSSGTAIVTKDNALLWTDGRYFIQAANQIKDTGFELMKQRTPGYPDEREWLKSNLRDNSVIGFNGEFVSESFFESLRDFLKHKNISFKDELSLVEDIWQDRPPLKCEKGFVHDIKYTKLSAFEKIEKVRDAMKSQNQDLSLISSLDDIAYLTNLRGNDVLCNPVIMSYLIVDMENAYYFVEGEKLTEEMRKHLVENHIFVKDYHEVYEFIKSYKHRRIRLDKSKINRKLFKSIDPSNTVINGRDISSDMKAVKNEVELEHQKNAYRKDAVALVKFFKWITESVKKGETVDEIMAEDRLESFRKEQDGFIEPSFETISAYGANAAMMHYKADRNKKAVIEKRGLYLVDSGGQYSDGTTDITRTLVMGEISEEEKRDYTLTLKGHINLASAVFLEGTSGHALDVLSRIPLWRSHIDYKCGTGHGVGYLLCVHEGPHRIANAPNNVALEEGMIVTIEPGVYKEGKFGIRLENVVAVKKDLNNSDGQFYKFDMMSFIPFDLKAIDVSLLDKYEIDWLNEYHRKTYQLLSPYLNESEKSYLMESTREI